MSVVQTPEEILQAMREEWDANHADQYIHRGVQVHPTEDQV